MVKKFLLCLSLISTILFFYTFGFAGTFYCDSNGCNPGNGSLDFKCSKNVRINCNSDGQRYAANSSHYSGDKVYGVSSDSSIVYYTTKSKGSTYNTNPSSTIKF